MTDLDTITADDTELVTLDTAEALYALRDSDWHGGAMKVLRYPSADPIAVFSWVWPFNRHSVVATVGDTVWKDGAGNFGVVQKVKITETIPASLAPDTFRNIPPVDCLDRGLLPQLYPVY